MLNVPRGIESPSHSPPQEARVFQPVTRTVVSRVLFAGTLLAGCLAAASSPAGADDGITHWRQPLSSRAGVMVGTLVAMPPVVQPGLTPAAPPTTGQVVATFDPARKGSVVLLERKLDDGWRQVARKRQDAWGSAAFAAKPGTYRARTETGQGLDVVTGRVVSRAWTPSFEDTFSGPSLDATVWNDQRREHESVSAPRTCARTDPAARRVKGGVLHLGIALDPARLDQRCHYTTDEGAGEQSYLLTSQVATEHTRLFRHGIAAARIKPQQAKGMHSGFWMLPEGTVFADGDPSAGTEIDVMEFFGKTPRGWETIGSFVYYYEPGWRSVKHGGLFPGGAPRTRRRRTLVGRVPRLHRRVDARALHLPRGRSRIPPRDQRRIPRPAVPRALDARLGPRARRADRGRARRHRPGRLGQGLRRDLDDLDDFASEQVTPGDLGPDSLEQRQRNREARRDVGLEVEQRE
jgi:hypothetical protein